MPFVKPSCSLSGTKEFLYPPPCPRDNTIQGYHSKGQRGQGEKAAAKLGRNLVARELEWGCA